MVCQLGRGLKLKDNTGAPHAVYHKLGSCKECRRLGAIKTWEGDTCCRATNLVKVTSMENLDGNIPCFEQDTMGNFQLCSLRPSHERELQLDAAEEDQDVSCEDWEMVEREVRRVAFADTFHGRARGRSLMAAVWSQLFQAHCCSCSSSINAEVSCV